MGYKCACPASASHIRAPADIPLSILQIFFAIVILGLSGHLVATQAYGGSPSITNYEVFLGIWLFVISFVGLAGGFISALGGVVMVALDALSILFTFAGGVVCVFVPVLSMVYYWRMICFNAR